MQNPQILKKLVPGPVRLRHRFGDSSPLAGTVPKRQCLRRRGELGPPRFGVAIGDRRKVWTQPLCPRKDKVVNQTLPTRYWGSAAPRKAASQAGFRNRRENFFRLMTLTDRKLLGSDCGFFTSGVISAATRGTRAAGVPPPAVGCFRSAQIWCRDRRQAQSMDLGLMPSQGQSG